MQGWCSRLSIFMLMAGAVAQQAYKPLPKAVIHAHYVLVTTNAGDDLTNPNMMPDDRRAVLDVQDAIKKWGRYALAYDTKSADLILLVRKGRIAESMPGVRVGIGSQTPPHVGANVPTDAGDSSDMLALYDASQGDISSAPLWRYSLKGGLDPPQMELVQRLKQAVEAAAK